MSIEKLVSGKEPIIGQGIVYDLPIPLNAAVYKGTLVVGKDSDDNIDMYFSDGIEWSLNRSGSTVATEELEKTVGATGDFATLADAIAFFGGFVVGAAELRFMGKITILAGHEIETPVRQIGSNLSWVLIESEDAVVNVTNDAYAVDRDGGEQDFVFYYAFGSITPQFRVLFNCANTSWTDSHQIDDDTSPADGKRVFGIGLRGSSFLMPYYSAGQDTVQTGVRNFTYNIGVRSGSDCRLIGDGAGGDFTGGRIHSVLMAENSTLFVRACTIRGAASSIRAADNSMLILGLGNAGKNTDYRRTAGSDSNFDLSIGTGARAVILASSLGGVPFAPNIISKNGLIIDQRSDAVVSESYGVGFIIADDAVATIVPPRLGGFLTVTVQNGTTFIVAAGGMVGYSCGATLSAGELSFAGHGANLVATTGTLAGTTGTDGNVTVSARAADIQIENRLGGARTFYVSWM